MLENRSIFISVDLGTEISYHPVAKLVSFFAVTQLFEAATF